LPLETVLALAYSGNTVEDERLLDASLLIGLSRYDEAEDALRLLLAEADRDGADELASAVLEGLGIVATRRGQEARALELFEQALVRGGHPDPVGRQTLYTETARLRSFGGDAPGAIELLEECRQRVAEQPDPDPAVLAHYAITLNFAYADSGQYGKAQTLLASVIRDAEDLDLAVRGRLYFALARISLNTGRTAQAVEYADRRLEVAMAAGGPVLSDAHLMCAHTRLDAGDTELAGSHLEQARKHAIPPLGSVDEGFLLVEEARHALQLGDHELALTRARAAIELLGDRSVPGELGAAYLVIARIYDDTGDDDRADRAYRMAVDLLRLQGGWPTDLAKAYRRYGKFLRRRGRVEDALEMLEAAGDAGL
jgi:tetratricopeptide (TPR) repeat protein